MRQQIGSLSGKAKWMGTLVLLLTVSAVAQTASPVETPQRLILVSIQERKLAVIEDGIVLKVFSVAVGRSSSPSPEGTFTIKTRLENPTYYHKGTVIAPGPDNPLGSRWMGLSAKGYGIHGTNEPKSIGKAASHGCVRMGRNDLEELFRMVKLGDTVSIRGERDEQIAQVFGGAPDAIVVASAQNSVVAQAGGR